MAHRHTSASILFLLLVLLEPVTLGFCNAAPNVGCMDIERKVLLKLKQGLTDPSDRLSSWVGVDCCKWRGVGCNKTSGRVDSLNLSNPYRDGLDSDDGTLHALGGEINPSLLVLKDLMYLDLSMNNFGGVQLPSFIGSLKKMTYLNLSGASFGGVIPPNLGNLSRLVYLDLSNNAIESDLRWLPSLSSLKFLNLGGANLTKAAPNWLPTVNMLPSLVELHLPGCGLSIIPLTLPHTNFTSLSVLDLSLNGFNSTLSPWLFSLTELVNLNLSSNNLNGALPETIGSLTLLKNLDLSENSNIGGQLPRNLGMLCNLQSLKLSINNVTGEITDFIDSLSGCTNSSIETLDLGYNSLTGHLPNSLGYLTNLRYLILWFNSFQGSIPDSIGNLTSLEQFYLVNNKMGGVIPESFGQLSSLVAVDLSENTWEGVVTEAHFVKLRSLEEVSIIKGSPNISLVFNISSNWIPPFKLRYLNLRSCQLGPKFPTWLRNQTELATVVLNNARITDTIPDWFWQLDLLLDELDVAYNELSGRVPNSLRFAISANVDLSTNRFEGPLPLWSSNITTLYLRDNQFSGPIPYDIGDVMPSLSDLDISRNGLRGSIPQSLGNLSLLTAMVISNNYLSGEIPHFWNSIPDLYIVDMSNNNLSGTIPRSINSLRALRYLILSNNNLSGEVPSLRNCSDMKSLDLGENKFSGSIPAWIGENMFSLLILRLSSNSFFGSIPSIPSQFCGLTNLHVLDLSHNNLSGHIPQCIGNLNRMKSGESMLSLLILRLSSNSFTGSIPSQLCDLSNLQILDLSHNNLSGHIPHCVGNLSGFKTSVISDKDTSYLYQGKLVVVPRGIVQDFDSTLYLVNSLDLSNNNFSGSIPSSIGSLSSLEFLLLSNNNFSGELPSSLKNCIHMNSLDLGDNKFSGNIPAWIGEVMLSLSILRLMSNSFTGNIPSQLCGLTNLHVLDLSHNNLSGHIPQCIGNLSRMKSEEIYEARVLVYPAQLKSVTKGRVIEYFPSTVDLVNSLDLSNNNLSGEMPVGLTSLIKLGTLNLSMNHLTGTIPTKIGNLESIETLDLSINQLSGSIPPSMVFLTFLNYLNLSYNHLSGEVPTGNQFSTLVDPSIYEGNAALCGYPLPNDCQDNEEMPQVPTEDGEDSDDSELEKLWFIISMVIGFIVGFWGVCGSLVINKSWRHAYFNFLDKVKYVLIDFVSVIRKYLQFIRNIKDLKQCLLCFCL